VFRRAFWGRNFADKKGDFHLAKKQKILTKKQKRAENYFFHHDKKGKTGNVSGNVPGN
jgi:hypothetical protein